jgi:hypothetical protein
MMSLTEGETVSAPEIFWCDVHDFIFTAPEHFYRCSVGDKRDEDCRMVRKLLVDPESCTN